MAAFWDCQSYDQILKMLINCSNNVDKGKIWSIFILFYAENIYFQHTGHYLSWCICEFSYNYIMQFL